TGALSLLTALVFGLAPAIRAARAEPGDTLRMQARSIMGGGLRVPRILVAVQIALCFAALVAAGLLGRSLANLRSTDVGFDREQVAYATVNPGNAGYTAERRGPYLNRLLDEISRVP